MKVVPGRTVLAVAAVGCLAGLALAHGGHSTAATAELNARQAAFQAGTSQQALAATTTRARAGHARRLATEPVPTPTPATELPAPDPSPSSDPSSVPTPSESLSLAPTPGGIKLAPPAMDLTNQYVYLVNTSDTPMPWSISDSAGKLLFAPSWGTLSVGEVVPIRVTGYWPGDGHYSTVITAVSGSYRSEATMEGDLDAGPVISNMHTRDDLVCVGGSTYAFATFFDLDGVARVDFDWHVYDGTGNLIGQGFKLMAKLPDGAGNGGNYRGTIGPLMVGDPGPQAYLTWAILATDGHGKTTQSGSMRVSVDNCRSI